MCFAKEKKEVKSISKDPNDIILDENLQNLEILGTVNHSDGVEAQEAFFQQLDDMNTNSIQF